MLHHGIGLGLSIAWLWLFYLDGPLLDPLCDLWGIPPEALFLSFIVAHALNSITLAIGFQRSSFLGQKLPLITSGILAALCPLLTALLPIVFPGYVSPLTAYILATLGGMSMSNLFAAWMEVLSLNRFGQSCMIVGIAYAVASLMTIVSHALPIVSGVALLLLCPLLSLHLLLQRQPDKNPIQEYPKNTIFIFPKQLILLLIIIYMNGGILLHIITLDSSYASTFYWSYLLYALICPLMGWILFRYEDIDLRSLYRLILPTMLVGFLLLLFDEPFTKNAALLLLQADSAFLNMYTWLLFPYFARFSDRPAATCALGLAVMIASNILGLMLVKFFSAYLFGSHTIQTVSIIACLLSALAIPLFPGEKETFSGWLTSAPPELDPAEIKFPLSSSAVSQEPNAPLSINDLPLSTREIDVLLLLCKGRSGRYISEALNISNNTVKFHTRNIYSKLEVTNRQELLTLFETHPEKQ